MNTPVNRPVVAISAAIVVEDRVLLIRRGREPGMGLWTLPGGSVEPGETMDAALRREVREELALDIEPIGLVDAREIIRRGAGGALEYHYVVLAFAARLLGGEITPSGEVSEIRWAVPADLMGLHTTEGLSGILAGAIMLAD